ncbi:hypothetical protein AB4428_04540 [Vibrio lentus]
MKHAFILIASMFISFSAASSQTVHEDWVVNTDDSSYFYAATVNNSGHVFGKYCYFDTQQCLYLVGVDITCTKDNKYPVLINAESGSLHVNLFCGDRVANQNVLVFDNFDQIERTAKINSELGIAIPMESGRFKVSRFSLSGSTFSIDSMTSKAEKHLATLKPDSELL